MFVVPVTLNRTLSQMKVIVLPYRYRILSKLYQDLIDNLKTYDNKDIDQEIHSLSAQKDRLDYLASKPLRYEDWIWLCNVLKHDVPPPVHQS
jgi:hypothetical protein